MTTAVWLRTVVRHANDRGYECLILSVRTDAVADSVAFIQAISRAPRDSFNQGWLCLQRVPTYAASESFPVQPATAPPSPRIEIADLFQIAKNPDRIPWQPFQDGVEIHRLYGDGVTGPTAALIRFRKDGKVPAHAHAGYEHIIVLAGTQRDQNGTATAGTLIINPPGTEHSVMSEAGCIVLAIYEKPVTFLVRRDKDI